MLNVFKSSTNLFLFFLLLALVCIGCGGGGGDGGGDSPGPTPPSGTTVVTITGTVSGTEIIPFNAAGQLIGYYPATGNPKTFSLSLAVPGTYSIYLMENRGTVDEKIYPLYQGGTNVFAFDSSIPATLNLGFVDTKSGKAVPSISFPTTGVTAQPENTTVPFTISASAYTQANFQGGWRLFTLQSSPVSGENLWTRQFITADANGNATVSDYVTSKTGDANNMTVRVMPSGHLVVNEDPNFRGMMGRVNGVFVGTTYEVLNNVVYPSLTIGTKTQAFINFSQSDLEGTWHLFELTTNDLPPDVVFHGWARGRFTINATGTLVWDWLYDYRNPTVSYSPISDSVSVNSSTGVVTFANRTPANNYQSNYTVLTYNKNMMIYVESSWGSRRSLGIAIKVDPNLTFVPADRAFSFYQLETGDGAYANDAAYGKFSITASQQFAMTDLFTTLGPVSSSSYPAGTYALASDGYASFTTVTPGGEPVKHGAMCSDGAFAVAVGTGNRYPSGEKYMLNFFIR
jgi:hypothetical protein